MMQLLSYAIIGILLIAISARVSTLLCEIGNSHVAPGLVMGIASVLILVITLYRAGSILFSNSTYERLITLPFKHFNIILSRFIHVYFEGFVISLAIILPGMIAYAIAIPMPALGWVFTALSIILVPVIPITIAALIDFLAFSLTAKSKKKGIVSIIISIIGMLILCVVMFLSTGNPENLTNIAMKAGDIFGIIYPPASWYAASLTGDFLLFLVFVLFSIVIGFLIVLLFAKTFQKISAATRERCATPAFTMTEQYRKPLKKTLFLMERKRFVAIREYFLQSVIGYIILVIGAIAVLILAIVINPGEFLENEFVSLIEKYAFILPLVIVFLSCLVTTTSSAISIEGKHWWILKGLPIPMKTIARAKARLNLSLAIPCCLFTSIIGCIVCLMIGIDDIATLVMLFIFPLTAVWFCTYFNLLFNMKNPNLDWDNVVDAVKSGPGVLWGLVACIVIDAVGAGLSILLGSLTGIYSLGLVIVSILLIIFTILVFKKIGKINIQEIE